MYICICHAVTDAQIEQEVSRGARKMCDLKQRLGLCTQCGKCGRHAREVLEAATAKVGSEQVPIATVA